MVLALPGFFCVFFLFVGATSFYIHATSCEVLT